MAELPLSWPRHLIRVMHAVLRQRLLIAVIAGVGAGLVWPAVLGGETLHAAQPWIIATVFLTSGFLMRVGLLRTALARWKAQAAILLFALGVVPALAWLAVCSGVLAPVTPGLRDGFLLLCALPTTIASCVALTRSARADEALALVASTLGTLLGIVITPLWALALLGVHAEVDVWTALCSLAMQTALPLTIGLALRALLPVIERARPLWSETTTLLLPLVIAHVTARSVGALHGGGLGMVCGVVAATAALHLLLLLGAHLVARQRILQLDTAGQQAAIIIMAQKTAALGIPLAIVIAGHRADIGLVSLPIIIHHLVQLVVDSLLAARWRGQWSRSTTGS